MNEEPKRKRKRFSVDELTARAELIQSQYMPRLEFYDKELGGSFFDGHPDPEPLDVLMGMVEKAARRLVFKYGGLDPFFVLKGAGAVARIPTWELGDREGGGRYVWLEMLRHLMSIPGFVSQYSFAMESWYVEGIGRQSPVLENMAKEGRLHEFAGRKEAIAVCGTDRATGRHVGRFYKMLRDPGSGRLFALSHLHTLDSDLGHQMRGDYAALFDAVDPAAMKEQLKDVPPDMRAHLESFTGKSFEQIMDELSNDPRGKPKP